jgi:hypothetical protein
MSLRSRALFVDDSRESRDAWASTETSTTTDMTWQQDYQRALPKQLKRKSHRLRNVRAGSLIPIICFSKARLVSRILIMAERPGRAAAWGHHN